MQIKIRQGAATVAVDVFNSDTVRDLLIREVIRENTPECSIYLVYGGFVILDDSAILTDVLADGSSAAIWATCLRKPTRPIFRLDTICGLFKPCGKQKVTLKMLNCFVRHCSQSIEISPEWMLKHSEDDHKVLNDATELLHNSLSDESLLTWFGEYGCALLAKETSVGYLHLALICLDEWAFQSTYQPCSYESKPGGNVLLHLGKLQCSMYNGFMQLAKVRIRDVKKNQGNQKTPAMIEAILLDSLKFIDMDKPPNNSNRSPRGGFIGVGLHTVGINTAWPLILAVFQVLLESTGHLLLYRVTVAQLKLACVEELFFSNDLAEHIDELMQMLRAAVIEGHALAGEGHDMGAFEAQCILLRFKLDEARRDRGVRDSQIFEIPGGLHDAIIPVHLNVMPIEKTIIDWESGTLDMARKRALSNLRALPMCPALKRENCWLDLQQWLLVMQPLVTNQRHDVLLLMLRTTETFIFQQALTLTDISQSTSSDVLPIIEDIWDRYRNTADLLRVSTAYKNLLSSEVESYEVLVTWTVYSLVHAATRISEPLLNEYDVGLDYKDLQHLVLSEKLAVDAALMVAAYLNTRPMNKPVFTLRPTDATIVFATIHAQQNPKACEMWDRERLRMTARQKKRWNEVQEKKELLIVLDKELQNLNVRLEQWKSDLSELEVPREPSYRYMSLLITSL